MFSRCPSPDELAAFSGGRLDDEALDSVARHVSDCTPCQSLLDTAGSQDSAVIVLRAAEPLPFVEEPGCLRLEGRAGELARSTEFDLLTAEYASGPEAIDAVEDASRQTATWQASRAAALPQFVGRFPVRRLLGRGGFAEVYLCDHPVLEQPVAVKVPRRDKAQSTAALRKFVQEAKTVARLKHANIVQVFDADRLPDGTCFIVMEYVAGETLKDRLLRGGLGQRESAELIAKVAEAVHFANQKFGLVHRDLKPGNILLDEQGVPKVSDFGLALYEEEQRAHAGETAGTVYYMSPEQVRGQAEFLDARSDIWSLGVMLYELLTGRLPFGKKNSTRDEVKEEILYRDPKPPRQIADDVPHALEELCLCCLEKPARLRPTSGRDLAASLRAANQAQARTKWGRQRITRRAAGISLLLGGTAAVVGIAYFSGDQSGDSAIEVPPEYLEDAARVHEDYFLLQHAPQEFRQDPLETSGKPFEFDPDSNTLSIDSTFPTIVVLGKTKAASFRFSVDISRNGMTTDSGVFLGYDGAAVAAGRRDRFHTYSLHNPGDGKCRFSGYIQEYVPSATSMSHGASGISSEPSLPPLRFGQAYALEIEVVANVIRSIRFAGQAMDQEFLNRIPADVPVTGGLGVFNRSGKTTFRNARFVLI